MKHCLPSRRNGFSLVELMVVLFVMGLLASVAVLSMPGDERVLRGEAERFAARTVAARDQAITGARPVALVVGSAGYYFEERDGAAWRPLGGNEAGLVGWKDGTAATLSLAGPSTAEPQSAAEAQRSRVIFDPVGLASGEAAVRLVRGGNAMVVRVARDGQVRLDAA